MKLYAIILIFCLISPCLKAQGEGGVFTSSRLGALKTGEGGLGNNPQAIEWFNQLRTKTAVLGTEQKIALKDIKGSVYLDEEFYLGTVFYNKRPYEKYYLRYDGFNDEVEIRKDVDGPVQSLHKNQTLSCSINNQTLVYGEYMNEKGSLTQGYLFDLYRGKNLTIYNRYGKIFKEAKQAKTSLQGSFPHRFLDNETFVADFKKDSPPQESKNLKRLLFDNLGQKEIKKLKSYLKKANIDFDNETSILKMLQYLDSAVLRNSSD